MAKYLNNNKGFLSYNKLKVDSTMWKPILDQRYPLGKVLFEFSEMEKVSVFCMIIG